MKESMKVKTGRAGMPTDVELRKYEERVIPNLRGYEGTYSGVMKDMKVQQAGLKKAFKAGNSF